MKSLAKNYQSGFTLIEYIVSLVVAAIVAAMVFTFFGEVLTQSGTPIARLEQATNLQKVMENIVADYNHLNALNVRYHWQPSMAYSLNAVVTPKTIPANPDGGHYYQCTTSGTSGASDSAYTWPTGTGGTLNDGTVTWTESGNIIWQKSHLYGSGEIVVPIKNTGHYYKSGGGTSGTSDSGLVWPTSPGATMTTTDGTVTSWTEAGTILRSAEPTIENLWTYLNTAGAQGRDRYGTGYSAVTTFIRFNGTTEEEISPTDTTSERNILKVTITSNDTGEKLTEYFTIY